MRKRNGSLPGVDDSANILTMCRMVSAAKSAAVNAMYAFMAISD
jgi:hypothetical protein